MSPYVSHQAEVAAFLMERGYQVDVVRVLPTRHEFRFSDSGAEAAALEFHRGAMVVAKRYAAEMKALKSLMHNPQLSALTEVPRHDPRQQTK